MNKIVVRKRNFDQINDNTDSDRLDESRVKCIKFQNNEIDILLDRKVIYEYTPSNCNQFNQNIQLYSSDYWHEVFILHKGGADKQQILSALREITVNEYFIPVKYSSGKHEDYFLIHEQPKVLELLFRNHLEITANDKQIDLKVKLNVANHVDGQLNPADKITSLILKLLNNMKNGILDLTNLKYNRELCDIEFSLYNYGNFDYFCKRLVQKLIGKYFQKIEIELKTLILDENEIKHLKPLHYFKNIPKLTGMSLKNNQIDSTSEFEQLAELKLQFLYVKGNPIALMNDVNAKIVSILPSLKQTDLVSFENPPQSDELESAPKIGQGEVIKSEHLDDDYKLNFPQRETVKAYWNQVVIEHNNKFNGKEILKVMFEEFFDTDACYPCYYKSGENEDSFLLYMNFAPLNILVQNNLQMNVNENETVKFRLHLKCAVFKKGHVKWNELIPKVVVKRMNSTQLNLKNLQSDPELKDIIVNLSTNAGLKFILECAVKKNSNIIEIDLSHNGINMLEELKVLNEFPQLASINLSNNDIVSLYMFPNLNIHELNMDNNPVCDKFPNAARYVRIFKSLCPKLQYLDGHKINQCLKLCNFQNYFLTSTAFDAVDNFVNFFFRNFDDKEHRHLLSTIYNKSSILSVRFGTGDPEYHVGQVNIADHYRDFPEIEHDFVTLTTDTTIFNQWKILITINGIFKQNNNLFTFTRTFYLEREKSRENGRAVGTLSHTYNFEVQNEQLQYDYARDDKIINKAFKRRHVTDGEIENFFSGEDTPEKIFNEKLDLLKQTILMKEECCERFLNEANGDFVEALDIFIKLYESKNLQLDDFVLNQSSQNTNNA